MTFFGMPAKEFFDGFLEFIYILIGLQFFYTAYRVAKANDNEKKVTTVIFWIILGILFAFGKWIPYVVSGVLVVIIGILSLVNGIVVKGSIENDKSTEVEGSNKLGNKIFIPVIVMAVLAIIIAKLIPESSASVLGFTAIVAIIIAMIMTKSSFSSMMKQSDRMVQQVGSVAILPQLLAALGAIFTAAGVGDVIASIIGGMIPTVNPWTGSIAYILGMVIFTAIMGNAYAAFTVITAGIGVPFVIAQGADPAISAALAMTAGYCGTLLTPMAGNFNILPVGILEMKDKNGVLKEQALFSIVMVIAHILLMRFWAF
ncbi:MULTISPECIES: DUF979 domain-containing protein [Anaerococcus]|nr:MULTISPECIES: DUF979 domain-containing protein [Anaerococcus]MBP2069386.1 putative membrane protein [Anaerococcus nagyae]MDU1829335.1 DUF979 domain-containing protein [Anaerococcus sp.]MDU1864250.1 DUF979 domain-containing protein [Anaerococcus sp.]MDU2353600.1 DUF979 domain-containing protein [Anaerococcus sp.]MDU3211588.1 DUF979 domain-containing protein [Anaerococcus sp.]